MGYNISDIETQIIAILDGINELQKNFDYEPKQLEKLPCTTLWFNGFVQEPAEERGFFVIWRWILRLYVDLSDAETAQDEIKDLVPKILDAFAAKVQLNDTCLYSLATSGDAYAILDRTNPLMSVEINLEATELEQYTI